MIYYVIMLMIGSITLTTLVCRQGFEQAPHYIPGKATDMPSPVLDRYDGGKGTINKGSIHDVALLKTVISNALEYMDWNDYELMAKDAKRHGMGEQGTGFNQTLSSEEQKLSEKLFHQYKFNAFASGRISLERSMGDTRTDGCKTKHYLKNITKASVSIIVIFHNEKNSTILRLLHGIVNRSPAHLVKEIVLVDDCSTVEELKEPLENYVQMHFSNSILIRNRQRQGLIRTRMIGANVSTGDILLFLDAHMEVNYNYLPPLVEPIILDYRKIVCPIIDAIVDTTMQIRRVLHWERSAFSWDLVYRRLPAFESDETAPRLVPTMLGAAFAISRKWWEEIGRYDPGLDIWGGEQYEITFKSWMCGGSVVDAPCSRVAHLFRQLPYAHELVSSQFVERNLLRVAKVWMDEYAEYVFQRRPSMRSIEPGDLTEQMTLKTLLNCKPFKWYMTTVAPDILKFFPLIEPPSKAWGMLRNNYNTTLCVVSDPSDLLFLGKCQQNDYIYDWMQHIRFSERCFMTAQFVNVYMFECLVYEQQPAQQFVWEPQTGRIVSRVSKYCMDIQIQTLQVVMAPCNMSMATQSWSFDHFNSSLVDEAWDKYGVEVYV